MNEEEFKSRLRLTPRECDVLRAAAEGLTSKQVGDRLGLAESTVKTSLGRMMRRFACSNRMELITRVSNQLSDPDVY